MRFRLASVVLAVGFAVVGASANDPPVDSAPPVPGPPQVELPPVVREPAVKEPPAGDAPPAPPPRTRPGGLVGEAAESPERNRVDPSLNSDVRGSQTLAEIETFLRREKWPEVVAALQALLEGDAARGDTFTRSGRGDWRSLQRQAEDRVRTLPPAGRELYARVYHPMAADLLAQARRAGDLGGVAEVARRFLNTPAGREAAVDLALVHFDRGEYQAAVRWFDRAARNEEPAGSVGAQLQYAWALRRLGRREEAERILARVAALPDAQAFPPPGVASLWEWWRSTASSPPATVPVVHDWRMLLGNAAHHAAADSDEPLLLEQWQAPMTHVPAVRRQIENLLLDLRDVGRACLPATYPVVVENRVAVRTWRGVEVLDVDDGRLLWSELPDRASPERLLSGTLESIGEARAEQSRLVSQLQYGDNGDYDSHPLTGLLFHDTVSGMLSSDGRQLFVLSEQPVLGRGVQRGWWTQEEPDPFGRDWTSNRLTAYDVATGAVRWMVGGARLEEPFDLPLAGTYFFGPPTPADNELYVIGERDGEICLFVLDPVLGRPVYVQPLANSSARIDVDVVRRQWGCQPAVAEGIAVCPTTAGWLVAVERRERRLLWAVQVAASAGDEQRLNFGGAAVQRLEPLNTRWAMTPPVICQGRVLYTPIELPDLTRGQEPYLLCLDLETGRELWRRAKKEEDLYLAAVTPEQVLIVGRSRVQALSLMDGRTLWRQTLPVDSPPSGRGLMWGDHYLLPLENREVWSLRLADGHTDGTLRLSPDARPLGNLVAARGRLLSVDALEVRGFHRRSALEAEIARRLAEHPEDLWALVQQAELERMRGDRAAAVRCLLRGEQAAAMPDADQAVIVQWRRLLRELLIDLSTEDLTGRAEEFAALRRLCDFRTDLDCRRVCVERAMAQHDWMGAWNVLWPPASVSEADALLTIGKLRIRQDAWEAGWLQDLYAVAPPELRERMDAAFEQAVAAALAADSAGDTEVLERRLAFHAAGRRLTSHLAAQAELQRDFAGAEIRWRRLQSHSDPSLALPAGMRLVQWLRQYQLPADADALAAQVEARLARLPAEVRATLPVPLGAAEADLRRSTPGSALADWSETEFEAVPISRRGRDDPVQEVSLYPGVEPFYKRHRFEFLPSTQRLRITTHQNETFWSHPLPAPLRQMFDQTVGMRTEGWQAYVVWQGVVQALSLPDRRVRWTFPIEFRTSGGSYIRNARLETDGTLQPAAQFAEHWGLQRYRTPTGMLAAASAECLLLHGRREVLCLDPLTGTVLWTLSGVPPQTMIHGDGGTVYLFPVDSSPPLVLRAVDGRELSPPALAAQWPRAVALVQDRVIVIDVRSTLFGLLGSRLQLQAVDVHTGETRWTHRLDRQSLLGWLAPTQLCVLNEEGTVAVIDLAEGTSTLLGRLPPDAVSHRGPVQLLADPEHVFLLMNRPQQRYVNYLSDPWTRADGTLVCFGRHGQGCLWSQPQGDFQILLSQFEQSPVLVFVQQVSQEPSFAVHVELWDKRTGRKLLTADDLMMPSPLYQTSFDLRNRKLQMLTHNLGIEVRPRRSSPPPAAPSVAPNGTPPP